MRDKGEMLHSSSLISESFLGIFFDVRLMGGGPYIFLCVCDLCIKRCVRSLIFWRGGWGVDGLFYFLYGEIHIHLTGTGGGESEIACIETLPIDGEGTYDTHNHSF